MSTATLNSLLDMQEIDDMLDEAEAAFEAGNGLTNDEVFHGKDKIAACNFAAQKDVVGNG